MGLERKKAIYDICVEFDVVIVEDDPYYFLQEGRYVPEHQRVAVCGSEPKSPGTFLQSLTPSYLR